MTVKRMVLAVVFLCLVAGAAGTQGRAAVAAKGSHLTVHVREINDRYVFRPARLTVQPGTRVTWVNATDAPHTVTGTQGWMFASKMFTQHHSVSYMFKKAGAYHYMCSVHPYMKAMVVVHK